MVALMHLRWGKAGTKAQGRRKLRGEHRGRRQREHPEQRRGRGRPGLVLPGHAPRVRGAMRRDFRATTSVWPVKPLGVKTCNTVLKDHQIAPPGSCLAFLAFLRKRTNQIRRDSRTTTGVRPAEHESALVVLHARTRMQITSGYSSKSPHESTGLQRRTLLFRSSAAKCGGVRRRSKRTGSFLEIMRLI